tara:strand:- start:134 stop:514 length:381 start_codon:yes stop_codon:yes gene_type:complete
MMKFLDSGSREQLGISVVQLTALMVLKERDGCLMKELADTLMLDKSAVTGLARRMESNGLLSKSLCKKDSRAVRLLITDKGRAMLSDGVGLLIGVNKTMTEGFSETELDTVSRFLEHLTDVFTREA